MTAANPQSAAANSASKIPESKMITKCATWMTASERPKL